MPRSHSGQLRRSCKADVVSSNLTLGLIDINFFLWYNIIMIKGKEELKNRKIEIDLTGPQGNAFALLATAQNLAKQLSYSKEEIEKLQEQMTSSDYEHLISVFDEHFGEFIILYR